MNRIVRVLRALLTAFRMTLRGETPPASPYAVLQVWMATAVTLTDAAYSAADTSGLSQPERKAHTLTAEGRRTNMETILASVKFHAEREYPHLLEQRTQITISAIYATNVNDRFLLSKLFDSLEAGSVREAVGRLASHLESIPQLPPA